MPAKTVWKGPQALRKHLIPIANLEPFPGNPNRGDVDKIAESLERFGQVLPILTDPALAADEAVRIVAHHHVVLAAQALGWSHVAGIPNEFGDEEEARAYMLADNRLGALATIDREALAVQLELVRQRSLDGTGYDEAFTENLRREIQRFRAAAVPGTAPDLDETPELPEAPESKEGEVYELGPHRLMCGDATRPDHMETLMGDTAADVVFIDPPYAIYGSSSGLSASITDDKIVRPFFRDALAVAQRWTPYFSPVFVCCDWRSWPSWWEVAKMTRIDPKNLLVWDKGGAGLGNNFANTYELMGYFIHLPEQKVMTSGRKAGIRAILKPNVIRANRVVGKERQHNAAKPVGLIAEILSVSSERGSLVLDYFAGSGSTMIAAEMVGRRAHLMEIDPKFCDVIRKRWETFQAIPEDERAYPEPARAFTVNLSAEQEEQLRGRDLEILRAELGTDDDASTLVAAAERLARDLNQG